jgi:dTDP-4-dehydrorhamnose 3,5-epimerase
MRYTETPLAGACIIDPERFEDERGFLAISWARDEFIAHGLNPEIEQCNISYNHRKGTVRGMHWQASPYAEVKLVRCTRGSIYDVIVDIRDGSPTYLQWFGVELTAENRRALYIPEGYAHGFQTLEDATELSYQVSAPYAPAATRGMRWNDPAVGIVWPLEMTVISDRDARHPDFGA